MINHYHNNRCSKSRAVQALIEASGHEFQTIYYLEAPPTVEKLLHLLNKGGFLATDLVRFNDVMARELNISKTFAQSDRQWCELLAEHPQLLERPIVETDKSAAIGRPIDNIRRLLDTL